MELYYEREQTLFMRDCDMFGRLRPAVALTMFQDCSEALTERWGAGLGALMARGATWVAAKLQCSVVSRLPERGDTIRLRAWVGRGRFGIFPFHYEIRDAAGDVLVEACSLWALCGLESRSMLDPGLPRLDLPTPEPAGAPLPRLRPIAPVSVCRETARRVLYSETDVNGHLTNTRYIDWVCDLAEPAFHEAHPMRGLRIDYRAELRPGEEAALRWSCTDERLWCACPGHFAAELTFSRLTFSQEKK